MQVDSWIYDSWIYDSWIYDSWIYERVLEYSIAKVSNLKS